MKNDGSHYESGNKNITEVMGKTEMTHTKAISHGNLQPRNNILLYCKLTLPHLEYNQIHTARLINPKL